MKQTRALNSSTRRWRRPGGVPKSPAVSFSGDSAPISRLPDSERSSTHLDRRGSAADGLRPSLPYKG